MYKDSSSQRRMWHGLGVLARVSLVFGALLPPMLGQVSTQDVRMRSVGCSLSVDTPGPSLRMEYVALPGAPNADSGQSSEFPNDARKVDKAPVAGQQTRRILFVVPNFHSVSADTQLPPQSFKGKLMNATEDTFDYSNFIFVGAIAGIQQAQSSTREFGQGARGYGRYYWHAFMDQGDENYLVEGIMPIVFRQDTRYYTLERGRFLRRLSYALSRGIITRSDSGGTELNYSEIIGAGAAAGISNLYYPEHERTWTKTGQKWVTNVGLDVISQAFREFWPDINRKLSHR
jgi:hypothetical protein